MRVLLLNQTFHPDVMATGQYLAQLAVALVERGHEVTVVTSRRGYDHPETLFDKEEVWRGVRILRVNGTGFGKSAKWRRGADFASFMLLCAIRLVFLRKQDVTMALTSPPLISLFGALFSNLKGGKFIYWVMDMNPDEAVAAGWLRQGSVAAGILEWLSRFSFRHASAVIALDRFMRDRIVSKGISPNKVHVLAPWSHDDHVEFNPSARERFRAKHGLQGKFVVMYSGNHSPCHPLHTLMEASGRLRANHDVAFCFVGGGSEWTKIRAGSAEQGAGTGRQGAGSRERGATSTEKGAGSAELGAGSAEGGAGSRDRTAGRTEGRLNGNIICLPYQPLSELSASLSAADLQVVVMGDPFVGLVHPCKIYNILNVGAPVLCIGPSESHLSDIARSLPSDYPFATARHGDVDAVVAHVLAMKGSAAHWRREVPQHVRATFEQSTLLPKLVSLVESA